MQTCISEYKAINNNNNNNDNKYIKCNVFMYEKYVIECCLLTVATDWNMQ